MSYEHFAYLYDELMKDAPYEQWVRFVKERVSTYQVNGKTLLDIGCGTGELSIRLAREGFKVTGVDLSGDMLSVANAKAEEAGVNIPFFEQNMADLEGQGEFDIITIFCDSLNYLSSEEDVIQTFKNGFAHLKDQGIFLFDVHSLFKINEVFINETFALNDEHIAYIWNSFPGEMDNSVEHELSFFVLDEKTEKYDRYDELHFQRTFPIGQYTSWLTDAGFELLEVCADFTSHTPKEDTERIFFVARKK